MKLKRIKNAHITSEKVPVSNDEQEYKCTEEKEQCQWGEINVEAVSCKQ